MRKLFIVGSLLLAGLAFGQDDLDDGGPSVGERFFHNAGIAIRLIGNDSLVMTVGARSEDLQNTVNVFPYGDSLPGPFRELEKKLELYFQDRIPVNVDGKRVYLRVVQWKPRGKGREDGLDMASLYVDDLFISLGGRLPKTRSRLDVTTNMWLERNDAAETLVQYTLFQDRTLLRRLWAPRERTIRFPISADSLKAMRATPPPPIQRDLRPDDDDEDHSGHGH